MKKIYKLENLDCAVCAQKIENGVNKIEGIKNATVSFLSSKMAVEYYDDVNFEQKYAEIIKVCKKIEPDCIIKG